MAVAAAAVVGGWAAPAHAGTPPVAQAVCTIDDDEPLGTNRVHGRLQGFAADQDSRSLLVMKGERNGRTTWFSVDFATPTESDGSSTTPAGSELGVPFSTVPVEVGWIVYRDLDADDAFDRTDEIVFEGDAVVTACPQTVNLSSK